MLYNGVNMEKTKNLKMHYYFINSKRFDYVSIKAKTIDVKLLILEESTHKQEYQKMFWQDFFKNCLKNGIFFY